MQKERGSHLKSESLTVASFSCLPSKIQNERERQRERDRERQRSDTLVLSHCHTSFINGLSKRTCHFFLATRNMLCLSPSDSLTNLHHFGTNGLPPGIMCIMKTHVKVLKQLKVLKHASQRRPLISQNAINNEAYPFPTPQALSPVQPPMLHSTHVGHSEFGCYHGILNPAAW